jgi:LmbE family N-acetylglucosaminyl deacetylase
VARVLIVAAHPDDELLGVGGTLLRHKAEGDHVTVMLLACGPDLIQREKRVATAQAISKEYGLDTRFGGALQLATTISAPRLVFLYPDIVYTHHPGDLNPAHRAVSEAVQVACRPTDPDAPKSLRYFETPSSTEWGSGFVPNLFVDIDAHLAEKVHLVGRYETEMRPWPHPRSEQALIDRARYWGQVSGFRAAEAFMVGRERW